jgi:hypothetical protein
MLQHAGVCDIIKIQWIEKERSDFCIKSKNLNNLKHHLRGKINSTEKAKRRSQIKFVKLFLSIKFY